jgi:hypothetical protein
MIAVYILRTERPRMRPLCSVSQPKLTFLYLHHFKWYYFLIQQTNDKYGIKYLLFWFQHKPPNYQKISKCLDISNYALNKIWGSHSGGYDILGHNTVWQAACYMFHVGFLLRLHFTSEDEGDMFLRKNRLAFQNYRGYISEDRNIYVLNRLYLQAVNIIVLLKIKLNINLDINRYQSTDSKRFIQSCKTYR